MSTPQSIVLSVVMPLYNEGARITPNVEQTLSALRMLGPFEIILVNDGSSDNSGEEIAALAEKYAGEVIPLHLSRSGKGEALRQGAHAAITSCFSMPTSTFRRSRFSFLWRSSG
jgi:glycosyltransferase involved in cell wall biosynthesis